MTMYWRWVASSRPKSKTWTMLGCTSRAADSASRRKRATNWLSSARCSASSLTATSRSRRVVEGAHARSTCRPRRGGRPARSGRRGPGRPSWRRAPDRRAAGARVGARGRWCRSAGARRAVGPGVGPGRAGVGRAGVGPVVPVSVVVVSVVVVSVVVVSVWVGGLGLRLLARRGDPPAEVADAATAGGRAACASTESGSASSSFWALATACAAAVQWPARIVGRDLVQRALQARGVARRDPAVAAAGHEHGGGRAQHEGARAPAAGAPSLPVLQALGQRVGQARGADRGRGAGDVVLGAPPARGPGARCRAAARRRAGRRRAAGRRCPG